MPVRASVDELSDSDNEVVMPVRGSKPRAMKVMKVMEVCGEEKGWSDCVFAGRSMFTAYLVTMKAMKAMKVMKVVTKKKAGLIVFCRAIDVHSVFGYYPF